MGRNWTLIGVMAFVLSSTPDVMAAVEKWNLHDVSVLFGLPQGGPDADTGLLGPDEHGDIGTLLPADVYALLPTLYQPGRGNASLYARSLRVTAMRIDPCPASEKPGCRPELRLVWQPVEFDEQTGLWLGRDAAVHCIHAMENGDFARLTQALWQLKLDFAAMGVETGRRPLGVHPAAADPRTAGLFSKAMRSLVLRYAGEDNLTRVTFAALRVPTRWWRFGALEKDGAGHWRRIEIPRMQAESVDIFNVAVADGVGLGPERGVDAIFNVLPEDYPERDNLLPLINKGYRYNDERDIQVFRQKLDAVARFRNPGHSNADTLDCASCHYADAARFYAENRFPGLADVLPEDAFENPDPALFNLRNTTIAARSGRVVRAFGFHQAEPVVSQRTINESAVVADWLNRRSTAQLGRGHKGDAPGVT